MISFREYLKEEVTDNLIHYTTLEALKGILKNGYLKGHSYDINADTLTGKKSDYDVLEICLTRKSNQKNIHHHSVIDKQVMIIFDMDNIKNIRGVKKPYVINEPQVWRKQIMDCDFSILDKLDIPAGLKRRIKHNLTTATLGYRFFANNGQISIKYLYNCLLSETLELLKPYRAYEKLSEDDRKKLRTLVQEGAEILYYKYYREGEERIQIPKKGVPLDKDAKAKIYVPGIPVSSKYMKIIIDCSREASIDEELRSLVNSYKEKDQQVIKYKGLTRKSFARDLGVGISDFDLKQVLKDAKDLFKKP